METGMPDQIAAALPPSSLDAERSVLGAMLQDSGAATLAFETLMPDDFYSAEHREIGYESQAFIDAENQLSWFNTRVYMQQREDKNLDFNLVIADIFEGIREGLKKHDSNVPHLKMFAADSDEELTDFFKASLIGVDYDVEYDRKLERKYSALSLIINARCSADPVVMADVVDEAVDAVSEKYNMKVRTFFMETFGMMEDGKGNIGKASRYD